MVGLLDIAPLTEKVAVGGVEVEVKGLGLDAICSLLDRFPEVRKALATQRIDDVMSIIGVGGDVSAAIIAAGCGKISDKKYEDHANQLDIDTQTALIAAIVRLTLKNGLSPLVERLNQIGLLVGEQSVKGQDTNSQKQRRASSK